MYKELRQCRICGNTNLVAVLNLGKQYLTGIFPRLKETSITCGPLELVKCHDESNTCCGLLQLKHSYDLNEMYGDNYGYRSSLNKSMVQHLCTKVNKINNTYQPKDGDVVVDIGSNDGTLLKMYDNKKLCRVGFDPSGKKFKKYYPDDITLICDFFSGERYVQSFGAKKAKIVTSIAMFYDLESPLDFMQDIKSILADDGVWVFEQSYMPRMLEVNAYDTICHEHLEYYALSQIKWMTDKVGLKILDVCFNDINGGSFSIVVAKNESVYEENTKRISKILQDEELKGINGLDAYTMFRENVFNHRDALQEFVYDANKKGKKIMGYGASTKGNVVLQFCGFNAQDIPCIAEVNEDKYGAFTPGTGIPIKSEQEVKAMGPDYLLVLPWHFKDVIIEREKNFLESEGKLLFPLPEIRVCDRDNVCVESSYDN